MIATVAAAITSRITVSRFTIGDPIFGSAVGFRKLGVDLGNLLGLAKLLGGLGGDCGLWSKTSSHVNDDPEDTTSQN